VLKKINNNVFIFAKEDIFNWIFKKISLLEVIEKISKFVVTSYSNLRLLLNFKVSDDSENK